ncbi:DUF1707 and FHA domain-containing protein [Streptomyces sp. H10-C2]|uniref:DUF1707 and FHA domain-containing protein n=1 Tax=unclassified Streptomyces TaxID=2593676 RepID=UPI0024BA733D|nr:MULTISPECIES: DUF1707 and FHA domain-containing protein [unclassified Streptomyces]MDJ0341960.1 DUF1707 and FHA domain-containing protein [Streptomyces sp. PH10-H1]MDJ0369933.1 DUF1707 and FHA domain-containing protein [Streptomyces sp. H10-C2]MDJ0370066.1 DUF1707 and FHA domain-containing protein [Streptomyces sp. H10-C2]
MTSPEFRTQGTRPSEAERDRALEVLRAGTGDGRISHDTFMHRMHVVLTAPSRFEVDQALADLPSRGRAPQLLLRTVARISALSVRLRGSWRTPQLPGLRLPEPGPQPLRIGRAPMSDLRLGDDSVSRHHAELRYQDDAWLLSDLGSLNGTQVNGLRITGTVRVQPGDHVAFGRLSFRLASG